MPQRQINACFEQHVLPELSARLEDALEDIPEFDREDAVQDATCQALEVFRILRLCENRHMNNGLSDITVALAKFVSRRYLAGVRFANHCAATCL